VTKRALRLTPWQSQCLAQLKAVRRRVPHLLNEVGHVTLDEENGIAHVPIRLNLSHLEKAPGGLPIVVTEDFVLALRRDADRPPAVYVRHFRFLGHPHVLSGYLLCLYLDETREWDPADGISNSNNGLLNRLWRWLAAAARAEFDPDEALYHAVGGTAQISRTGIPLPLIVVRELPEASSRAGAAWLTVRSDWCLQLYPTSPVGQVVDHVPILFADTDLPLGVGSDDLREFLPLLDHASEQDQERLLNSPFSRPQPRVETCLGSTSPWGGRIERAYGAAASRDRQSTALLALLAASASRKEAGTPQLALIAVPHPRGGPRHLIAVYFDANFADQLRRLVAEKKSMLIDFRREQFDQHTPLKWCFISDERSVVSRRRDRGRPVNHFQGTNVLILGVGGIGSWMAEFIARAGATKMTVCDTGFVTGGLLVRQNYLDRDIGAMKADRIAERLKAIAHDVTVASLDQIDAEELLLAARTADLIIDATVNRAVARQVDAVATDPARRAVLAQVATDVASGSLGIAQVMGSEDRRSTLGSDAATGRYVEQRSELEAFHVFWKDPEPGDEFVPTRGCSLPTFHGSCADLAAVAASLVTFIASHMADGHSGTHFFALPHSGISPAHHYVSLADVDSAEVA